MGDMVLWDRLTRGRLMSQPIERYGIITGMIETAENLAKDYEISREEADAFAVRSHQNAARAWEEGKFDEQLVAVEIPQRKGDPVVFARDEGFRADASMETLGKLRAIDLKRDPDAIVTAGNASQQNDAAAGCLVVAEDKVEELGLEPILWFHSWSAAGCDPSRMGIGSVPAVERLFARNGLGWDDIGLIELNEAFAPQALAVLKGWGFAADDSRRELVNVNGSGISLGHPIGATGIRILADMAHEMQRREVRLRPRDHVHRRRTGDGRRLRTRGLMADWGEWIGREQRAVDRLDPASAARWHATFDRGAPASAAMPQGIHFCLCTPEAPTAQLGPDGHPLREDDPASFLPPIPLPRRMWASSDIRFHRPIAVGASIERVSRVISITPKSGLPRRYGFRRDRSRDQRRWRTGCQRTADRGLSRSPRQGCETVAPEPGEGRFDPTAWDSHRQLLPDERLLFRYSALTFNTHRIHYDAPYARTSSVIAGWWFTDR